MIRLLINRSALLGLLALWPAAAWAVNANPPPGSVMTYFGPTIGSDWNDQFTANLVSYLATPIYSGASGAQFQGMLGSLTTPDITTNATAIFQKITTGAQSGTQTNPAVYISATKTSSTSGNRATAIVAEGYDTSGGNGTFVEGGRFHATLSSTAPQGQADGVVCLAQSWPGVAWDFLIGCESAVENAATDAPISMSFNQNHFAVGFLSTIQGAGSHIIDAGFMVNPFNTKASRVGFFVPPGTEVTDAAFRSAATTVYGLDLGSATTSGAAIKIPNNQAVVATGVGGTDVNLFYVPVGSNSLILGTGTQGITLPTVSAPATPGAGFGDIYLDSADMVLKHKNSSGQVLTLGITFGTPASATATCTQGQMEFDATYIYTCISANSWHRVANGAAW